MSAHFSIDLSDGHDFEEWRAAARALVRASAPPSTVMWHNGEGMGSLFDASPLPRANDDTKPVHANKAFLRLAQSVVLHTDKARFAILYDLLWRMQNNPELLDDGSDPMIRRAHLLAKAVGRDIHKMRAFVRFREIEESDGTPHYVAWFEPEYAILRANAPFFIGRFATMRWTIMTPIGSLTWDGNTLHEGSAMDKAQVPPDDAAEDLWRTYYAAIFNPARLKVDAMVKEMPRRYWKNLPEAVLIPDLIAGAQAREAAMVDRGNDAFADVPLPQTLNAIAEGITQCQRCAIGCNGTRAVMGEGPQQARVMLLGEAPGDCEEREGRPFIGPAGQVLRDHLAAAGWDSSDVYVTSAVRHFKYRDTVGVRGKFRLHQNPTAAEIDHCRWWLDHEIRLVNPRLVIALGASAARALTGRTMNVKANRGKIFPLPDGRQMLLTYHPSYLLRLTGDARADAERVFAGDLRSARALMEPKCAR